jgi:hypothetical protein
VEQAKSDFNDRLRALGAPLLILVFGLAGLVMAHHPMILTGFERIQTDRRDSRLNHYILEHGYLWMRGTPGHRAFWNMPFFHPVTSNAAYSDILLSVGPVYWLWRLGGASPDLAFGGWMISVSLLNYAAGLWLFRKGLNFDWLPATAAAFLVAFGAPRVNQLEHQQLLPCFYMLLAIYALVRLFQERSAPWSKRGTYWLLAVLGGVLQLYSGFYLAWFFLAALGTATVAGLLLRPSRGVVLDVLKRDWWAIAGACAVGLLILAPLLRHYLPVARQVALHQYVPMYRALTPQRWSWLNLGENHWLWGWTARHEPFRSIGFPPEQWLGIGFFTPLASAAGLVLDRRPICQVAAAVTVFLMLATTSLPNWTLTVLASAVCFFCMAGLYHETDCSFHRGVAVLLFLILLYVVPFPNPYFVAMGVMGMILCALELVRTRGDLELQLLPAFALFAFCLRFFGLEVLFIGILMAAPVAAISAYYRWDLREDVALGFLVFTAFFPAVITLLDQPLVLAGVLAAAPIALAASGPRRARPSSKLMCCVFLACLPVILVYYADDSLWMMVYSTIPGGVGIRAVGRVALILLIPAALGLAAFLQRLIRSKQFVAAAIVGVACAFEQGVTTKSFDAIANRTIVAGLAQQVDRAHHAFYYHPCPDPDFFHTQLDAMWASLEVGVPTINGYSGYYPPEWHVFFTAGFDEEIEPRHLLNEWERINNLSSDEVQWIGSEQPCR